MTICSSSKLTVDTRLYPWLLQHDAISCSLPSLIRHSKQTDTSSDANLTGILSESSSASHGVNMADDQLEPGESRCRFCLKKFKPSRIEKKPNLRPVCRKTECVKERERERKKRWA